METRSNGCHDRWVNWFGRLAEYPKEAARRRIIAVVAGRFGRTDEERFDEWLRSGVVTIGRHTYGTPRIVRYRGDAGEVRIGSFCSIAEHVEIYLGGNHRSDWVSTFPFRSRLGLPGAYLDGHPASRGAVVIGNDVWIGRGATILSGVNVGDGAVIGARSVVTGDVRPYGVAAGNPAREIRRRFSDDEVERLLAVAWWDWPDERIVECVDLLSSARIEEFLSVAEDARSGP